MSFGAVALTHARANTQRKLPFFFSRFKFERMKQAGNTHFCFFCLSDRGFIPGPNGEPTNHIHEGYDGMKGHDPKQHAAAIIDDADKFDSAHRWLEAKMTPDFPCVIMIT